MASDLDGLRWRPLFQKPVMNSLSARLDRCNLSHKCWWICTYIQLSVISILVEGYHLALILSVRNEPNNIYHWGNEQNKKERAKNWTLRNASEWGVTRGGWRVNPKQKMNDLLSMNESRYGQFLTSRMYVQAYEGGWCGPECQKQLTYREQQEFWPFQNQWRPWYH